MSIKASASVTIADISDGTDGTGITSTVVEYQAGSSGTSAPTGTWSTSIPTTSASAPYLWTRVTYTYTDGSTPKVVYSVGSTPEGIEIGGRNLLAGTSSEWKAVLCDRYQARIPETASEINPADYNLKAGDMVALGFYVKTNSGKKLRARIEFYNSDSDRTSVYGKDYIENSEGYVYVATEIKEGYSKIGLWIDSNLTMSTITGTTTEYIKCVMFEKASKPSNWTPAPEDIDSKIETVSDALEASDDVIVGTQTSVTGSWTGKAKFAELKDGQRIAYWLPYNGSGNATLNLTLSTGRTTGEIACYYSGSSRITTHYPAGNVIHLTYKKDISIAGSSTKYTGWWADANYDSGNTYDRTRYNRPIKAGTTAIVGGNLIVGKDGTYTHLKLGSAFDVNYPILYAVSAISASSTGTNNYLAIPFTVTTTQSITLTAYKPVYIKGRLSGSLFTPVSTTPLTQTVPTSEDGYQYILLGTAYSTTDLYFLNEHPIFQYHSGAFKTTPQIATEAYTKAKNAQLDIDTANGKITALTTETSNLGTRMSKVEQTADKISWVVKSGTSSTNFTLTDRTATLIADVISLNGNVKVDGDMLVDKAVTAKKIDVEDLFAQDITATGTITGATLIGSSISTDSGLYNLKLNSARETFSYNGTECGRLGVISYTGLPGIYINATGKFVAISDLDNSSTTNRMKYIMNNGANPDGYTDRHIFYENARFINDLVVEGNIHQPNVNTHWSSQGAYSDRTTVGLWISSTFVSSGATIEFEAEITGSTCSNIKIMYNICGTNIWANCFDAVYNTNKISGSWAPTEPGIYYIYVMKNEQYYTESPNATVIVLPYIGTISVDSDTTENYVLPVATASTLGGVKAESADANDTVPVHIKSDGTLAVPTYPTNSSTGGYVLPAATASALGGVKAASATENDTVPVHIKTDGTLVVPTYPTGSSSGSSGGNPYTSGRVIYIPTGTAEATIKSHANTLANAGGGTLLFDCGEFTFTSQWNIPQNVNLLGQGRKNTVLKANASMYSLLYLASASWLTRIENLSIDGNWDYSSENSDCAQYAIICEDGGFQGGADYHSSIVNTSLKNEAYMSQKRYVFRNLYITGASDYGVYLGNANYGILIDNCDVSLCNHGLRILATDCYFEKLYVERCKRGNGIYVTGGNNKFTNCKVIWCGQSDDSFTQYAVRLEADRCHLTNVECQDNYCKPFYFKGSGHALIGVLSDSNGYSNHYPDGGWDANTAFCYGFEGSELTDSLLIGSVTQYTYNPNNPSKNPAIYLGPASFSSSTGNKVMLTIQSTSCKSQTIVGFTKQTI